MSKQSGTYVWQGHSLEFVIEALTDRHPEDYPWGMLLRDDLARGEGEVFYWFESPSELLAYLAEAEPLVHLDRDDPLVHEIRAALIPYRDRFRTDLPDLREFREVVRGAAEILWWGRFADLCAGKGTEERRILRTFRTLARSRARGAIKPTESERFVGYLCNDLTTA